MASFFRCSTLPRAAARDMPVLARKTGSVVTSPHAGEVALTALTGTAASVVRAVHIGPFVQKYPSVRTLRVSGRSLLDLEGLEARGLRLVVHGARVRSLPPCQALELADVELEPEVVMNAHTVVLDRVVGGGEWSLGDGVRSVCLRGCRLAEPVLAQPLRLSNLELRGSGCWGPSLLASLRGLRTLHVDGLRGRLDLRTRELLRLRVSSASAAEVVLHCGKIETAELAGVVAGSPPRSEVRLRQLSVLRPPQTDVDLTWLRGVADLWSVTVSAPSSARLRVTLDTEVPIALELRGVSQLAYRGPRPRWLLADPGTAGLPRPPDPDPDPTDIPF